MNNKIKNILEFWGRSKRSLPTNNEIIKERILLKVPANFTNVALPVHSPFPWPSIAFTAIAVVVLIVNLTSNPMTVVTDSVSKTVSVPSMIGGAPAPEVSNQARYDSSYSMSYYYGGDLPITDDREFLKVGYNAALRTREVSDAKTKIESMVRGVGGRVDGSSGGDRHGYVSFAIPKEDLEAFKLQIKDLVGARFYSENTSSQNFLPQKQMIEESRKQTEQSLISLKSERAKAITTHNQAISSYQTQINSKNTEISILNTEYTGATAERRLQITNKINQLQAEISTIQSQVSSENKNYNSRIYGIDSQIRNTEENLKNIQTQDKNLIASVETVNGSVSLSWISLWEMADAYLPGPILTWVFLLGAVGSYFWYRRFMSVPQDYF